MNPIPAHGYTPWESYAASVADQPSLRTSAWKRNQAMNNILEHVPSQQGYGFLIRILSDYNLTSREVVEYCSGNDQIGGAVVESFGLPGQVSSSSLRYLFHACEVLRGIQQKHQRFARIVEVGCGYGGLAYMIGKVAPRFGIQITEYVLYDLPGVQKLQKKYLEEQNIGFPVSFPSCQDGGASVKGSDWWLVSAYAIGEFEEPVATQYIRGLVPRTEKGGGFLIWNTRAILPVIFQQVEKPLLVSPEVPQTGGSNRVIQW
jgi:hypothetical protein